MDPLPLPGHFTTTLLKPVHTHLTSAIRSGETLTLKPTLLPEVQPKVLYWVWDALKCNNKRRTKIYISYDICLCCFVFPTHPASIQTQLCLSVCQTAYNTHRHFRGLLSASRSSRLPLSHSTGETVNNSNTSWLCVCAFVRVCAHMTAPEMFLKMVCCVCRGTDSRLGCLKTWEKRGNQAGITCYCPVSCLHVCNRVVVHLISAMEWIWIYISEIFDNEWPVCDHNLSSILWWAVEEAWFGTVATWWP